MNSQIQISVSWENVIAFLAQLFPNETNFKFTWSRLGSAQKCHTLINISPLNMSDIFHQDPGIILRELNENVENPPISQW